jgi:hypothetical protein
MIKLKDLLDEASETVFRPTDWLSQSGPSRWYYRVLKPFSAETLSGIWDKTNQYYGSSQVSKQRTEKVSVKKGAVVVNLPGGFFVLDTKKKQAWPVDWKSLTRVKSTDVEQITDKGEIKNIRWDVFKSWEPYKTYFEKKTGKR